LIDIVGRGDGLGRPLLYGTTQHFQEHFGFTSLDDLPRPDELPIILKDRMPLQEGEGDLDEEGAPAMSDLGESPAEEQPDNSVNESAKDVVL
jgi:segregation and condensation protein B